MGIVFSTLRNVIGLKVFSTSFSGACRQSVAVFCPKAVGKLRLDSNSSISRIPFVFQNATNSLQAAAPRTLQSAQISD